MNRGTSGWCMSAAVSLLVGCGSDGVAPDQPLPTDATLRAIDLGWHALDVAIDLEIPEDALGVTVAARANAPIGFAAVRAPDESAVVADFALGGVVRFSGAGTAGDIAVALPQSDASIPLVAGRWRLQLGGDVDHRRGGGHLTAWIRSARDGAPAGRIDVNVFAARATATAGYLRAVLSEALDGFAGLRLGQVVIHELGDDARVVEDEDEARALLFATHDAELAPAVNLIAVSDMSGLLGSPSGRAGGVPGLGCDHGTSLSGVLVEVSGDAEVDAARVRHETGHLAGLFHTSDEYGFDPLGDTAECTHADDELCPDADNVMFPRATAHATRTELTAAQARVVLGSTLYRAD